MLRPHALRVAAGVDGENVWNVGGAQLAVEALVLVAEAIVVASDVEGDQGRVAGGRAPQHRHVAVRARARVPTGGTEVERMQPGRIGRMEVSAPRLDDGERVEMMERQEHCAVAPGGEPEQRAATARRDRPVVLIDVVDDVAVQRGLPVSRAAPVQVLRVRVAGARPLRRDHDRLATRPRKRVRDETAAAIRRRRSREPVQEIDHGVAARRARVRRR